MSEQSNTVPFTQLQHSSTMQHGKGNRSQVGGNNLFNRRSRLTGHAAHAFNNSRTKQQRSQARAQGATASFAAEAQDSSCHQDYMPRQQRQLKAATAAQRRICCLLLGSPAMLAVYPS
jgi:hypothetical protein